MIGQVVRQHVAKVEQKQEPEHVIEGVRVLSVTILQKLPVVMKMTVHKIFGMVKQTWLLTYLLESPEVMGTNKFLSYLTKQMAETVVLYLN